MNGTIFRKKSLERIASPDSLDDYLKVSSPSIWLIVSALAIILTVAGAWCFLGKIPTITAGIGIQTKTETLCFVPAAEGYSIEKGMQVRFTSGEAGEAMRGKIVEIGEPVPAAEAAEDAGAEWLAMPDQWVCPITVRMEEGTPDKGKSYGIQIVIDEQRPVDLLLGR